MSDKASDKTSDKLLPCPFCGGENIHSTYFNWTPAIMCECGAVMTVQMVFGKNKEAELVRRWNTRKPMDHYEDLEERLQSVYGECDGLLEKVVEGLVKHEGVEFEKPMKSRLLTDDDVDKWDRLKGAMERIVERLEEVAQRLSVT